MVCGEFQIEAVLFEVGGLVLDPQVGERNLAID